MPKAIIPFNKNGTFGIQSVGAPTVTATDVTLNFEPHLNVNTPYNGLLIVNITSVPATSALPVFSKQEMAQRLQRLKVTANH